jgi:hypothetical protein
MAGGIISAILLAGWVAVGGLLVGGPIGLLVGLAIGLALGAAYGWAITAGKAYDYSSPGGVVAFVVDHSWSVLNTLVGSLFLAGNVVFGNKLDKAFTQNRNRIGLHNGVFPGFATTIGTVQAGTGMGIDDHEAVHVLQARIFGPMYMPLVIGNYILATVLPYWLLYHDRTARPITGLFTYFKRGVYPHTWNEEWAYKVQGTPPL